jgi:hypothetical protein
MHFPQFPVFVMFLSLIVHESRLLEILGAARFLGQCSEGWVPTSLTMPYGSGQRCCITSEIGSTPIAAGFHLSPGSNGRHSVSVLIWTSLNRRAVPAFCAVPMTEAGYCLK